MRTGPAVSLRSATEADARIIASRLRVQDMAELLAMRIEPLPGVLASFRESTWCEVIVLNDRPVAIFGVAPSKTDGRIGVPWLVGTQDMERLGSFFIRGCRPMLQRTLDTFPALMNLTHRDNSVSRRWLDWLGFHFAHHLNAGAPFVGFWAARAGYEHLATEALARCGMHPEHPALAGA